MSEDKPIVNEPENTISTFVEVNHKLITVLGVFTALTVFAANLPLRPFGNILSFMFLALAILVWLELWAKFPKGAVTWRLNWFENILSYAVMIIIAYWFLSFRDIWRIWLPFLIALLFLAGFSMVMKRYDVFDRLFKTEPGKETPPSIRCWNSSRTYQLDDRPNTGQLHCTAYKRVLGRAVHRLGHANANYRSPPDTDCAPYTHPVNGGEPRPTGSVSNTFLL